MKCFKNSQMLVVVALSLLLCVFTIRADAKNLAPSKNIFAQKGFTHVLGPSPALVPDKEYSSWEGWRFECGDVLKDHDTYYWYYHGQSHDKQRWPRRFRMGVATAPSPLGPWKKYENNPIMDQGPEGAWDNPSVDCASIIKEGAYDIQGGTETYYMWYGNGGEHIGLATASNPLGPWKKYENNPVVKDFGYLGGVVRIDGKFYMFVQYPVSDVTDQGPFRVAVADKPQGPWEKYEHNPIMTPGDWGSWDDGGFSEARVRFHEGIFHCFYGGTKTEKLESIGYAYSFDGYNWIKYEANPVIPLYKIPDAAAFAEVHALFEGPFVYLYHTLRNHSKIRYPENYWETEYLAIQVLTINPHFKIAMPVLMIDSLGPKKSSVIDTCLPMSLDSASSLALETECTYDTNAKAGLRLHVRASSDGKKYNNVDLYAFDIDLMPGQTVNKTVELTPKAKFIKVIVENLDDFHDATSVKVTATLGN
ncbi:hypothetical protein ACFL1G_11820 [Planctomycetota bacterium]